MNSQRPQRAKRFLLALFASGAAAAPAFGTALPPSALATSAVRPAQTPAMARLFPEDTLLYVEAPGLADLFDQGLDHPMVQTVLHSELGLALTQGSEDRLEQQLAFVELFLGRPLFPTLASLGREGAALGVVARSGKPGYALAVRGEDAEEQGTLIEELLAIVGREAGMQRAFEEPHEVLGEASLWSVGDELHLGHYEDLLFATNDRGLLRQVVERAQGPNGDGLAGRRGFGSAMAELPEEPLLAGSFDLAGLRDARPKQIGKGLRNLFDLPQRPQAQFLLGPGLASLGTAQHAALSLDINEGDAITLTLVGAGIHGDRALLPDREDAFAPLPKRVGAAKECARALVYRNFAEVVAHRAEIFPAELVPEISKGMNQLSLLFGGIELEDDVLPGLSPWLTAVVRPVEFDEEAVPELSLPAAAAVVGVEDPTVGKRLVSAFQTMIALINLNRAEEGGSPLVLRVELEGKHQVSLAGMVEPPPEDGVDIAYNLVPACALVGDAFVIGTHEGLVRELVRQLDRGAVERPRDHVERLELFGPAIAEALRENEEALVMSNVLEEGNTFEEAQEEIGGLIALIDLLDYAELSLAYPESNALRLELSLELASKVD